MNRPLAEALRSADAEDISFLADALVRAFLTLRYDVDVKPEELYDARTKAVLKQQVEWNLRHRLALTIEGQKAAVDHRRSKGGCREVRTRPRAD
jgi:hypothetical protein